MKIGAYFIICPVCKHRIEITNYRNSFTAECKNCGVTIGGDFSGKPLSYDDIVKAGEKLQESFLVEPEQSGTQRNSAGKKVE